MLSNLLRGPPTRHVVVDNSKPTESNILIEEIYTSQYLDKLWYLGLIDTVTAGICKQHTLIRLAEQKRMV